MTATNSDTAAVTDALLGFIQGRTKLDWTPDQDLFASGAVTSLFAMELVMFVEQTFGVTVAGPDLTLDNFRTVGAMTALVTRLQA
jgi:methoxymalonate biosynthesis acyl carrier protein